MYVNLKLVFYLVVVFFKYMWFLDVKMIVRFYFYFVELVFIYFYCNKICIQLCDCKLLYYMFMVNRKIVKLNNYGSVSFLRYVECLIVSKNLMKNNNNQKL